MADFQNLSNFSLINTEPHMIVDEASTTEFYVGTSINVNMASKAVWKIKKIWKSGNIWHFGYPNGDQTSIFVWNDRTGYTYQ